MASRQSFRRRHGYDPLFAPGSAKPTFDPARAFRLGDRGESGGNDVPPYVYDDEIVLAVNVALAAGRPLLVRGPVGTGKSSLARSVSDILGWRHYEAPVSSRITAADLLWSFDAVARLADAEARTPRHRGAYVQPGPLWWAFDRELATRRGLPTELVRPVSGDGSEDDGTAGSRVDAAVDPCAAGDPEHAVVLIDEIDKADPDVPNDLLVPLGSYRFRVDDGPEVVAVNPPLVVLTTNEERDLPRAFLRRCVILELQRPDRYRLEDIIRAHFPDAAESLLNALLDEYERVTPVRLDAGELPPSAAELLDAVAACVALSTGPEKGSWQGLAALLLDKATAPPDPL